MEGGHRSGLAYHRQPRHASGRFQIVVPVPASSPARRVTRCLAQGVAAGLGVSCSVTALTKLKSTSQMKSVLDVEVRRRLLRGAFRVDKRQTEGKSVLLVDDVYRSGVTLECAAVAVAEQGNPAAVYVLAVTRTRVHR